MSSNANSLDSNQKAIAQRQYREKEGDRFAELQLSIRDVTGGREYPDTRHDILTTATQKIIELNRQNMELRQQLANMQQQMMSNPSFGAPGGHGPGGGQGGAPANHYAPGYVDNAWGHGYNTGSYAQHHPGQGRHA